MNTVQWFNFDDTEVDFFWVYRSIPGIQFLFSALTSSNPVFKFSVSDGEIQEIAVNKATATSVANSINTGRGILANVTGDGLSVQVRVLAKHRNNKLKVLKSNFATDIGYPNGTIVVPELNYTFLDSINFVPQVQPPVPYSFIDQDGSELDSYRITSVLSGNESLPSVSQKALPPGVAYCIVEARFINTQGRPVHGVHVTATPAVLDLCGLTTNVVQAFSDEYGRISIPLLRNQNYRLDIPAAGHSRYILTPDADFIDIAGWPSTTGPDFSPNGDPP